MNLRAMRTWFLWGVLLVGLAVLAGCQAIPSETDDAPGEAAQEPAAVADAGLPEGGSFTVGFTPDGHAFKGNPQAAVIIEEFSSYQCPFCGRYFDETYPDLMSRYVETGQVMYVFKDFPLDTQPQSPQAAEAARCVGEVGGAQAYWDMHDLLFVGQRDWSGRSDADQMFKNYAAELGVDQAAFDECLDSGRMADKVEADAREGAARGVSGTPSFFIAGQIFVGAQPIGAFASAIERALAGEPVSPPAAADDASGADSAGADALDPESLVPDPVVFDFDRDDAPFALGDPNAAVTIVEFSDFQCPYCSRYSLEVWPALKERYVDTGRVYYVFKDFPLTDIHPQAPQAAQAAHCAAEQDAFWEMHDQLFGGQEAWSGNPDPVTVFKQYASALALDQGAFDECLDGGRHAAAIDANQEEGLALGVTGTPLFFVAGYPFSGARPIEFFDQAIALAEDGQLRDAIVEAVARALEEEQQQAQPRPTMAPADVPLGDAPIKGDSDAPVTIVEYSDYQCPFCVRHSQETLPQLLENYVESGQVRYVFKDFPLTSIHPQAVKAAEAARCAREIGGDDAYWQMHDRLFERQGEWSGNPEHEAVFKDYAGELGLDQAAFGECLDSGRYTAAIKADLQEGAGFGVTGTPAFFVNGQPLEGAQPYEAFVQVIETFLAEE